MPVDLRDARLDVAQARFLGLQHALDLGALERQHAAQLGRRDPVLQQRTDLLQRKAELLERQDAVQARQLPDAVEAVAGLRVGMRRLQHAELVVEAQLPGRDLGDLRELADAEHQEPSDAIAAPRSISVASGCSALTRRQGQEEFSAQAAFR